MDNELISVIVPVYNVEKYLEKCINSILAQTYKNLEIILVDDGSPDSCPTICDHLEKQDDRILVIHKQNGGLSSARNAGLDICRGKFVTFVDSDDWVSNSMIQDLYEQSKKAKCDIVCCGKTIVDKTCVQYSTKEDLVLSPEEAIRKSVFDDEVSVSAWGKLYRKDLFVNLRFPVGEIHEDVAVIYKLFANCEKISVLAKCSYFYRYNSEGISKQAYSHKYDVVLQHVLSNEAFISQLYPDLKKEAAVMVGQSCRDMMIKIVKSKSGYNTYKREYKLYRDNLIKRWQIYYFFIKSSPKQVIWLMLFLVANERISQVFCKVNLYK